jgi:hypothetical protein
MDIIEFLIKCSPFIISGMALYILIGLVKISNYFKTWETKSLCLLPGSIFLLYAYIGLFSPHIELSRNLSRIVMSFNLGVVFPVIQSFLQNVKSNSENNNSNLLYYLNDIKNFLQINKERGNTNDRFHNQH